MYLRLYGQETKVKQLFRRFKRFERSKTSFQCLISCILTTMLAIAISSKGAYYSLSVGASYSHLSLYQNIPTLSRLFLGHRIKIYDLAVPQKTGYGFQVFFWHGFN